MHGKLGHAWMNYRASELQILAMSGSVSGRHSVWMNDVVALRSMSISLEIRSVSHCALWAWANCDSTVDAQTCRLAD